MRSTSQQPHRRPGRLTRSVSAVSVAIIAGAIAHNALYAQQSRVFSETRISISADSERLDKLFAVLNSGQDGATSGRTRVSVKPSSASQTPASQSDAKVRKAQRALAALDAYSGETDGVLGAQTRQAIIKYQRDNGLKISGRPDDDLLEHLAFMSRVRQAAATTAGKAAAVHFDRASVAGAQRRLRELGYDPGPIDGMLGDKTVQSIRQFQIDARLPVDGQLSAAVLDRLQPSRTTQITR